MIHHQVPMLRMNINIIRMYVHTYVRTYSSYINIWGGGNFCMKTNESSLENLDKKSTHIHIHLRMKMTERILTLQYRQMFSWTRNVSNFFFMGYAMMGVHKRHREKPLAPHMEKEQYHYVPFPDSASPFSLQDTERMM